MLDETAPVTRESLARLAAYLPELEATGADFAAIERRFVSEAYTHGWVRSFAWPAWTRTDEAVRLKDDPTALAAATPHDLMRILTAVIRLGRFSNGAVAGAFASGLVTAIVRRAAVLSAG